MNTIPSNKPLRPASWPSRSQRLQPLLCLACFSISLSALAGMSPTGDEPDLIQTFSVGRSPQGLAFDGDNIWVTNERDDTVSKLRASDGTTLGTFHVGGSPMFATFDGANIWVTNYAVAGVTKLRASDGV